MAGPSKLTGEVVPPHRRSGWKSRVCVLAFFLLLVALSGRLAWAVLKAETGWPILGSQFWDATLGIVAGRNAIVSQQDPSDQAAFWLSEAKRITAAEPQSAERAMGAALVLDAPATGFMIRYLTMSDLANSSDVPPSVRASIGPQWDEKRLSSALAQFETLCAGPCLEMAARATDLEPENVCWWRLRALLQIAEPVCGTKRPRTRDWLSVVEHCGSHEPDNAIYDYVIASRLWEDSVAYDYSDGETRLEVKDKAMFEEGLQYFERGQKKKACRIGDEWCRSVVVFLGQSGVGPMDRAAIAESRLVHRRVDSVMMQLVRTQLRRAEQLDRTGDPSGALALLRQGLHCLDQFNESRPSLECGASSILRSLTLTMLQNLTEKHSKLVSSRELALIKSDAKAAVLRNRVLVESSVRRMRKQADEPVSMLRFVWFGMAISSVTILLAGGVACWLVGRYLSKGQDRPADLIGPYRHAAAWITGYGLSFAVLGMAPAEVIPVVAQTWIASVFVAIAASSVLIWLVWRLALLLKGRVRAWLVIVLGIVLALALLPLVGTTLWNLSGMPARGWDGANVHVLRHFLGGEGSDSGRALKWTFMQWCAGYPGGYVSLIVSIALVVSWHTFLWARTSGPARRLFRSRSQWAGLFACAGRSMLFVGGGWLLVYLLLAPSTVQLAEDAYQEKMAYYRNPRQYWSSVRATIDEVEADKAWMDGVRADGQSN